ncbi:hypothetical protein PG993_002559 [Apiospora rasikravindrae]|uniref:Rhodopsin domain-containing protein n=1 Tax=Apiospora rasikravindrae TaxID=990691 RepID=A0ABR1TX04_9PEZI
MPYGLGRHLWNVTAEELAGYFKFLLFFALTYIWVPTLAKLAILVLYHQINPFKPFRICVYITATGVIIYTTVITAILSGPCNPVDIGSGTCLNNTAMSQAVLNIFSDVLLIVMPIPMIHGLRMPLRQKIIIGGILTLGSSAVVASIVRISYIRAMMVNPDTTWTQASAIVWSSVEMNLGVACNCMARLRPFVRVHMPKLARRLDYDGNVTPHLATVPSLRGPGWDNEGGGGGTWSGGEEAMFNVRLHGFEGRNNRSTQGESGYILVRDEATVDVGRANASSRECSSEDLIRH